MDDAPSGSYELTVLLAMAFRTVIDDLQTSLDRAGYPDVRPAHGFAFVRLAPDGATGNDLADYLGITKQAASQMVDYLEQRGYVTRQPNPRDGRGKIVTLTERGWQCIGVVEAILADIEARCSDALGVERMDALRADLRRLVLAGNGGTFPRRMRPVW